VDHPRAASRIGPTWILTLRHFGCGCVLRSTAVSSRIGYIEVCSSRGAFEGVTLRGARALNFSGAAAPSHFLLARSAPSLRPRHFRSSTRHRPGRAPTRGGPQVQASTIRPCLKASAGGAAAVRDLERRRIAGQGIRIAPALAHHGLVRTTLAVRRRRPLIARSTRHVERLSEGGGRECRKAGAECEGSDHRSHPGHAPA
jgi:hypothetical protein